MAGKRNQNQKRVGRLAAFGIEQPWQAALFLPESYEDLSNPLQDATKLGTTPMPIELEIAGTPKAHYNGKAPRLVIPVRDRTGTTYLATIFGDTKEWMASLKDVLTGCFMATADYYRDDLSLRLSELVEPEWVGRVRPKYAGVKKLIAPQTSRRQVLTLLPEAIPLAAAFIAREMKAPVPIASLLDQIGARGWSLEQLLLQAHQPRTMAHAQFAVTALRRIAAIGALQALRGEVESTTPNPLDLRTVIARIAQLPFPHLTDDQHLAIHAVADEMRKLTPARVICTGEVGTGKTTVAAVISAATVDAVPGGGSVMVLCPNTLLAEQLFNEFHTTFPDIPMQLVTRDTPKDLKLDASILIGTSALLHRDMNGRTFDLLVVDEQHRWSRAQREVYLSAGTHLLEMSATPIPRSIALIRYGKYRVVPMKETHAKKKIHTLVFVGSQGRKRLFPRLDDSIARGNLLLVVHPKRTVAADDEEASTDLLGNASPAKRKPMQPGAISDKHSVELARERWERMYPGKVGTLTSDDEGDEKRAVLASLKNREIQICLCTTVIEVGITVPELYHVMIVHPERLGLMQLHQLRGRVARGGGTGFCILYCPEAINEKQRNRLQFFSQTYDGFELAEFDMRERGIGNISSTSDKQSGADDTFLFGLKMDVDSLDAVAPLIETWRRHAQALESAA